MLSGDRLDGGIIANYDFDIEYIEGKTNTVADGLSATGSPESITSIVRSC